MVINARFTVARIRSSRAGSLLTVAIILGQRSLIVRSSARLNDLYKFPIIIIIH